MKGHLDDSNWDDKAEDGPISLRYSRQCTTVLRRMWKSLSYHFQRYFCSEKSSVYNEKPK